MCRVQMHSLPKAVAERYQYKFLGARKKLNLLRRCLCLRSGFMPMRVPMSSMCVECFTANGECKHLTAGTAHLTVL